MSLLVAKQDESRAVLWLSEELCDASSSDGCTHVCTSSSPFWCVAWAAREGDGAPPRARLPLPGEDPQAQAAQGARSISSMWRRECEVRGISGKIGEFSSTLNIT